MAKLQYCYIACLVLNANTITYEAQVSGSEMLLFVVCIMSFIKYEYLLRRLLDCFILKYLESTDDFLLNF